MPSTKSHYSSKIEISRGRYKVCKYQYWKLDCLDLFIELLILLNCKILGTCRPCTNLLRFVVETLRNKWDDIRFIDFEEALALAKDIKTLVPRSVLLDHYTKNRDNIKYMCKKAKILDELAIIVENQKHFFDGEAKHLKIRNLIYNLIKNRGDVYMVDDFKDDDEMLMIRA